MQKLGCGIVFAILFGGLWCGLTFTFDGVMLVQLFRQVQTFRYSATEGTVTHSAVKVNHDSEGNSYSAEVHFRYQVNGQAYEGKTIRYDYAGLGKSHSEATVRNYPVQQTVPVYYHPSSPQHAVLETGLAITSFAGLLFLTPFNAFAFGLVGGVYAWLRGRQLGRPVIGLSVRDDGLNRVIRIYQASPAFMALVAWGATGFITVFGVMLASIVISLELAIAMGGIITLTAPLVGWWLAAKYYSQLRRDTMRGTIEIREADGRVSLVVEQDLQPARYSRRQTTDSDGDKSERFPVELPFHDPATNTVRSLKLPEQVTEEDAKRFVSWLNGELRTVEMLPGELLP
ncbi:DUF3592 domain-containing protein [Anatilimnocola sp. NA78]|uniref:DUF3592 domain-containing protein n=1 Tax=Anatilimnocola sp. NA78 TaxID=3415683 RepID=UPI003CE49C8F